MELGISNMDLKDLVIEIVLKMNEWRRTFPVAEIANSYYVASEVLGVFLRVILMSNGYEGAEDCSNSLNNLV